MVSVTELLLAEGFIDSTWFDEYSRTRGEYIHKAIHLYDIGDLDEESLDPILIPYLDVWKKFLIESKFEVLSSEVKLISDDYSFSGRPDKIGLLNGTATIIDVKSGAVQSWTALQLAGYEILKGCSHKRIGVQLTNEDKYKLTEFKDRQDRGVFLSALSCYRWKQNNLRGRK